MNRGAEHLGEAPDLQPDNPVGTSAGFFDERLPEEETIYSENITAQEDEQGGELG